MAVHGAEYSIAVNVMLHKQKGLSLFISPSFSLISHVFRIRCICNIHDHYLRAQF